MYNALRHTTVNYDANGNMYCVFSNISEREAMNRTLADECNNENRAMRRRHFEVSHLTQQESHVSYPPSTTHERKIHDFECETNIDVTGSDDN